MSYPKLVVKLASPKYRLTNFVILFPSHKIKENDLRTEMSPFFIFTFVTNRRGSNYLFVRYYGI